MQAPGLAGGFRKGSAGSCDPVAGMKKFRPTPRVEGLPPELEKREAKPLSHPIQASPTANFPTAKSLDLGAVRENSCRRLSEEALRLWEDPEE